MDHREPGPYPPELTPAIDYRDHVILRVIIGSRAYGLDDAQSDTDYRGCFLPPAEAHWSLPGVPEQVEVHETQEHYWEIGKLIRLALRANPNVLECLYTPLVDATTPLGAELLAMRRAFLSNHLYETYNGYVLSQFKKAEADLRNRAAVKPKHAMHLVRLLLAGAAALVTGELPVRVEDEAVRARLLAIKRGEIEWGEVNAWRIELHAQFEQARARSCLPDRPDFRAANDFLIRARRHAANASP